MARFDAAADKRIPDEFSVGNKIFKVLRSGSALKKIVALDTEGDRADDPEFNIEMMYVGISYVLSDPERDPETSEPDDRDIWRPKPAWLEDNVDFGRAEEFMTAILPKREGADLTPSAPSVPSSEGASTTLTTT